MAVERVAANGAPKKRRPHLNRKAAWKSFIERDARLAALLTAATGDANAKRNAQKLTDAYDFLSDLLRQSYNRTDDSQLTARKPVIVIHRARSRSPEIFEITRAIAEYLNLELGKDYIIRE